MSKTVFWDTAAFIALGNQRDNLHKTAVQISQILAQQQAKIITTDAVLTEVANSFSKPTFRSIAGRVVDSLYQSVEMGVAELVHIDETLWQKGWAFYQSRPDKEWGLTDCLSFVVMQIYNIHEAFTSDHHFEQAGFVRLMQVGSF